MCIIYKTAIAPSISIFYDNISIFILIIYAVYGWFMPLSLSLTLFFFFREFHQCRYHFHQKQFHTTFFLFPLDSSVRFPYAYCVQRREMNYRGIFFLSWLMLSLVSTFLMISDIIYAIGLYLSLLDFFLFADVKCQNYFGYV